MTASRGRGGPTGSVLTEWLGANRVDVERDGWTTFWRIDPSLRGLSPPPVLWERASMPAGVRASWRAHAEALELQLCGDETSSPVDVLVDSVLAARVAVSLGACTIRVPLPDRPVRVDLWLSQFGQTRARLVGFAGGGGDPLPATGARWTVYGSSITQCRSADGPTSTWPARVALANGWDLRCLGFAGQCHLDPVVARTIRDTPAELITLCLGINIYGHASYSQRTLSSQIIEFVHVIREGHAHTPIVVTTPIASPERETIPNAVGMTLASVRVDVADAAALADDAVGGVTVVDGLSLLDVNEAAPLLGDGLHPTDEGYALIASRLGPRLAAVLAGEADSTKRPARR